MRSLEQALYDHELIVLRVIGEWWELDLTGSEKPGCVKELQQTLVSLDMAREMNFLPPEDAKALADLAAQGGRIPVAAFTRDHGEIRLMGPGRLEREEPWLDPVSPAEALWYRGFLYRGFDETSEGVLEYYYLPQELMAGFPQPADAQPAKEGPPRAVSTVATPKEWMAEKSDIVDDLTTVLALAQQGMIQPGSQEWTRYLINPDRDRRSMMMTLANETGMLKSGDRGLRPTRDAVNWMKQSREAQLRTLADAWSISGWNELRHTPGLACEGEGWQNDPLPARTALLESVVRDGGWYPVSAVVGMVKENDPDFQRPDGNYDTWYVRDLATDSYLTGFENWDLVEGRLLHFLLAGPGYWLGLTEVSSEGEPSSYRLTQRALDWLAGTPPADDVLDVPLVVQPDATLVVPFNAGRYQRFQAARISVARAPEPGQPFRYRLTPDSLEQARDQGISPERILKFLEDASGRPLPASVRRGITRWAENGVEGRVESVVVLKVRDAKVLETLRTNPKTRDYFEESLGDLSVTVRSRDWSELVAATAELGLLLDINPGQPI